MPALGRVLSAGVSRQSCRRRLQRSAHRSLAAPMTAEIQIAALLQVLRRRVVESRLSPQTTTYGLGREFAQPATTGLSSAQPDSLETGHCDRLPKAVPLMRRLGVGCCAPLRHHGAKPGRLSVLREFSCATNPLARVHRTLHRSFVMENRHDAVAASGCIPCLGAQ